VTAWIASQREQAIFLSALTIGEIQRGISRLPQTAKREHLERWLHEDVRARFGARILPVDQEVALLWGSVQAALESQGRPMAAVDGLLSATARARGLTLVTRNTDHYKDSEVPLFDPWP
jgi:hypothetical protein